jgi:hypothetical protein
VSERLGHSSVSFTLDTYGHVLPHMQPEAVDELRKKVFEDDPSDTHSPRQEEDK